VLNTRGAEAVPKTRQSAEGVAEATSLARIGVMRALNGHVERVFNPDRKETHWGKHKLKRDGL